MKQIVAILLAIQPLIGFSQHFPLTVAESSNFQSTSTYTDVMAFTGMLQKESKHI